MSILGKYCNAKTRLILKNINFSKIKLEKFWEEISLYSLISLNMKNGKENWNMTLYRMAWYRSCRVFMMMISQQHNILYYSKF